VIVVFHKPCRIAQSLCTKVSHCQRLVTQGRRQCNIFDGNGSTIAVRCCVEMLMQGELRMEKVTRTMPCTLADLIKHHRDRTNASVMQEVQPQERPLTVFLQRPLAQVFWPRGQSQEPVQRNIGRKTRW